MEWLFLYGTLRAGEARHGWIRRAQPRCILPAEASGRLLDLGQFPAMIGGNGRVTGEAVGVESLTELLPMRDEVEGSRFGRAQNMVETARGPLKVWTYLWIDGRGGGAWIEPGNWRRRSSEGLVGPAGLEPATNGL